MAGLVACLWLVSRLFCGLFCGHSIILGLEDQGSGCLVLNNMFGGSCMIIC